MQKLPLTIRHLMAIAMLIMSFQNVMAMGGNTAGCENSTAGSEMQSAVNPHQGHNMADMDLPDTNTADEDTCTGNCCCDEPCTDMADNCGTSMQLTSLILTSFEFTLSQPTDSFSTTATQLPDLPPLPPIKPPV
ncbi:MAG: hypothetical protein IMF09_01545 [Proteobacteria bacterium]|nr:hypothetical protein [Pseudomonadota bacterium]